MEDIQSHLQGGLGGLLPLLLDQRQPGVQPGPAIGDHRPKRRPVPQRRGPRRSTAITGPLAQHPGHALRLHRDQHGLTPEEDLIEAGDRHQGLAGPVQALQQTTGLDGLLVDPAAHGRVVRTEGGGQEEGQQAGDLAGTEAHRRRHGGEVALLGLGELDGVLQPVPELTVLAAEVLDLVEEFLAGRAVAVLLFDGLLDAAGVLVGDLSATAGRLGLTGDVAPASREHGGGIADPGHHG